MTTPRRIFISTSSFGKFDPQPLERLKSSGFSVELNPYGKTMTEQQIAEALKVKGVEGLIAGTEPLTSSVLEGAKALKAIARVGTGMDSVDLPAAKQLGIPVSNTPDGPTDAVAELTLCLMIDLLREVTKQNRQVLEGNWKKTMGSLLRGKRVGFLGFGRIARRLTELLAPFHCKVLFYDPYIPGDCEGADKCELDDLLKQADLVSLHLPLLDSSRHIIGENELAKMKKSACLLNVSRGGLVNENALHSALIGGKIAAAALDVFETEPYVGPLLELPNLVVTPHIGGYAREGRIRMERDAVENLLKALG